MVVITAILNLTINNSDTSITEVIVKAGNDSLYTQSGTYYSNTLLNNSYSMNFNGVDDGISGISFSLDATNTNLITISAWIYPHSIGPSGWSQRIFTHTSSSSSASTQQYALNIDENGNIYFLSGQGNFEQNGGNIGASSVILNQWNHISMTYDGSAIRFYMNGFWILKIMFLIISHMTLVIFILLKDGAERFDGIIDDINIWNIPLSVEEIQHYMNCPPDGGEFGLVAYWNFEEGNGNVTFDQTVNGNIGTINGI